MKKRIAWVDSFRALMIFCIVFGHAIPDGLLNRYVFFHVAAFFFISGYLFSPRCDSFGVFVRRKFKALMIPYYCFALISIFVFFFLGSIASNRIAISIETTSLMPNFLGMLYANGNTNLMKWNLPLWFLPCLFAALLIMFGIHRCCRTSQNTSMPQKVLFIALIAFLACDFINYYCLKIDILPFGFENSLYLMPFMLLGYSWRRIETHFAALSPKKLFLFGFLLIIIGYALAWTQNVRVNYINIRYGNLLVFYSSSLLTIIGFLLVSQILPQRFFQYIGQNTMPILMMHKFPLVFMQMFLAHYLTESAFGILLALLITLFSVFSCLLIGEILKHYVPWAIGVSRE